MSSDAIVVLKADHKEIRGLFREFQAAGDNAHKKKAKVVGQIIRLLTVHTFIENEVMYPEVRKLLPELEDDVLESYEEHHVADLLCVELSGMPANAERFDAKTTVLIEKRHASHRGGRAGLVPEGTGLALAVSSFRNSGQSSKRPGRRRPGHLPSLAR